ncbi:MAG: rhodanese-like domain-containing protein [Oscillochloris sp.]|nr:rhodanese-like domain-containing protein [Oscillochloris sp.]
MFQNLFRNRAESGPSAIDVHELKRRIDGAEKLFLLDVRSSEEYNYDGHIAGSRLLPLPMLSMRLKELPKDTTIVCVCRSGNRSSVACEQLTRQGFNQPLNLTGGMIAWQRAGYPTRKG